MDWSRRGDGSSDGDASDDGHGGQDGNDGRSGGGLLGRFRGGDTGSDGDDADDAGGGRGRSRAGRSASSRRSRSDDADDGGFLKSVRDRIDPRDAKAAAESAGRGALLIGIRLVGAALVAYGLYVLILVNGWNELGVGLVVVGVVPAYSPGFVVGLGELLWKLFRLA